MWISNKELITPYLSDASNMVGEADFLVRPSSTEEVAEILRDCKSREISVTISSGRTSTVGGAVPKGGLVISTERLPKKKEINANLCTAGSSWFLGELQMELQQQGWFFPPDPTSRHECMLGGAISCNASGARTYKFGATRSWIESVIFVTAQGQILEATKNTPSPWPVPKWTWPKGKHAAGYQGPSLLDLVIGSEGTLGLITEATIKLIRPPKSTTCLLIPFSSIKNTLKFVKQVKSFDAWCVEYMDSDALAFMTNNPLPKNTKAAIYLEFPDLEDLEPLSKILTDPLNEQTIVTHSPEDLRRLRHSIPANINEHMLKAGMIKIATDLATPSTTLETMINAYNKIPIAKACFGHIGDSHLHLNMLPKNSHELEESKRYYNELAQLAVSLGGTISAEHGIGRLKKHLLPLIANQQTLTQFRQLKEAADPAWILGQGILIDR